MGRSPKGAGGAGLVKLTLWFVSSSQLAPFFVRRVGDGSTIYNDRLISSILLSLIHSAA